MRLFTGPSWPWLLPCPTTVTSSSQSRLKMLATCSLSLLCSVAGSWEKGRKHHQYCLVDVILAGAGLEWGSSFSSRAQHSHQLSPTGNSCKGKKMEISSHFLPLGKQVDKFNFCLFLQYLLMEIHSNSLRWNKICTFVQLGLQNSK